MQLVVVIVVVLVVVVVNLVHFYAPQLYRQVLLRRVLAMVILSVCLSVRHGPVQKQPSDIETPGLHRMIAYSL